MSPERNMQAVQMALTTALAHHASWYTWGGDDPAGFDCSGFAGEVLKSAGYHPTGGRLKASQLFDKLKHKIVEHPDKGCLVFVERTGSIIHVEICLNDKYSIGASGGGKRVRTIEDAIAVNAFIKIRPLARFDPSTYKLIYVDPFKEKE